MADKKTCEFCNAPAVWRWKPESQFLCDAHAAYTDLSELEDLVSPLDIPFP